MPPTGRPKHARKTNLVDGKYQVSARHWLSSKASTIYYTPLSPVVSISPSVERLLKTRLPTKCASMCNGSQTPSSSKRARQAIARHDRKSLSSRSLLWRSRAWVIVNPGATCAILQLYRLEHADDPPQRPLQRCCWPNASTRGSRLAHCRILRGKAC